jgi:hypothetical protein
VSKYRSSGTKRWNMFGHFLPRLFLFSMVVVLPYSIFGADLAPLKETKLYRETATDCQRLDLSSWSHPTRTVLEKNKGVTLDWVELCNNRKYPIYGVHFTYDPQGQTRDYFIPLYFEMLKANGRHPFSFVSLSDNLIINIAQMPKNGISERFEDFSE